MISMAGKKAIVLMIYLVSASVLCRTALAARCTVALTSADLTAVVPEDTSLGNYYLAAVTVPEILDGKELLRATLELNVDVSAREVADYVNDTPLLEVYTLTDNMGAELQPGKFRTPSPMRRNVRVGTDRHVRIDVTEAVREFIRNPSSNHGLVIGSLTNRREGLFTVRPVGGAAATITYYYVNK